jgi:hypothetical protein
MTYKLKFPGVIANLGRIAYVEKIVMVSVSLRKDLGYMFLGIAQFKYL